MLGGRAFDAVLCHGVVMYLDDPEPLVDALCRLAAPDGLVSIVVKNAEIMALRPALQGVWAAAITAFDCEVNGLGVDTRGDHVDHPPPLLEQRGVTPVASCRVRLFTDGRTTDRAPTDPEDLVLQAELIASQRDPHRQLSRLFHLVGRRAK